MTIDRVSQQIVAGWRAFGRVILRHLTYTLAPRKDWWLLKTMNDRDLRRWADQGRLQRHYALARRRWAYRNGRPIKTEPHSRGRLK